MTRQEEQARALAMIRRLNAFCERYADNLQKRANEQENLLKGMRMHDKARAVRELTIPLFGASFSSLTIVLNFIPTPG